MTWGKNLISVFCSGLVAISPMMTYAQAQVAPSADAEEAIANVNDFSTAARSIELVAQRLEESGFRFKIPGEETTKSLSQILIENDGNIRTFDAISPEDERGNRVGVRFSRSDISEDQATGTLEGEQESHELFVAIYDAEFRTRFAQSTFKISIDTEQLQSELVSIKRTLDVMATEVRNKVGIVVPHWEDAGNVVLAGIYASILASVVMAIHYGHKEFDYRIDTAYGSGRSGGLWRHYMAKRKNAVIAIIVSLAALPAFWGLENYLQFQDAN